MRFKTEIDNESKNSKFGLKIQISGDDKTGLDKLLDIFQFYLSNVSNILSSYPVLIEDAKKIGFEVKYKPYGGYKGPLSRILLIAYRCVYRVFGREQYMEVYNIRGYNE